MERSSDNFRRNRRRETILNRAKTRFEKLKSGCGESHEISSQSMEAVQYSDPEVEPNDLVQGNVQNLFVDATQKATYSFQLASRSIFIRGRVHIFSASFFAFVLSLYFKKATLFISISSVILELALLPLQTLGKDFVNLILPLLPLFISAKLITTFKRISSLLLIMQSVLTDLAVNIFVICTISCILLSLSDTYKVKII